VLLQLAADEEPWFHSHAGCDFMNIQKSNDPVNYIEFERQGWGSHIEGYDNTFGAVTRQTVEATLDAAGVGEGSRLLDICCGPGMLSAAAVKRKATASA
jgi:2-polyprenyl-3-methyl-5-hydroxy-6-metoxy-1,4-benzoquinol methylase